MIELMKNVREWLPSQEACSASRIQRKFGVAFNKSYRAIEILKAEARISEDWDVSIGGYVVLGRQSNTGLQADGALPCCETNTVDMWGNPLEACAECGRPAAKA